MYVPGYSEHDAINDAMIYGIGVMFNGIYVDLSNLYCREYDDGSGPVFAALMYDQ